MNNQHTTISSPRHSNWDVEIDHTRPLSSSLELQKSHLWRSTSPVTSPGLMENTLLPDVSIKQTKTGCLGCTTWQRTIAFIFVFILLVLIIIVLPILLINNLITQEQITNITETQTTFTTTTSTTATTTQTITVTTTTTSICGVACINQPPSSQSPIAIYKFESNTDDETGNYPAVSYNLPNYTVGYAGNGISLDAPHLDRLIISPMNFYNRSFTIQLWFYLKRVSTQDNAFFGQQSQSNTYKHCLFLMTRLGRLYMGFYGDDTIGNTVLQNATWYHASFVYDNDKRQRLIYLNGVLDVTSSIGVGPYLGTNATVTIGYAQIDGTIGRPYYSGYIDELMIFSYAKTACEILNDASLVAYFPFDGSYVDKSPNSLSLMSSGSSFTTGHVNQAVSLSGSNSYIQISGLSSLGRSNYPFSIVFWIYPIVKGVLVHISSTNTGQGWCTQFINFDLSGRVVSRVYNAGSSITTIGPVVLDYAWTHIIETYSPTNGDRLYINGTLYSSSPAATIYSASGTINFLSFGNILQGAFCNNPTTVNATLQGYVDELRVYNRELSSVEACLLYES